MRQLYGRQSALEQLRDAVERGERLVSVVGGPGVGKTALVRAWAGSQHPLVELAPCRSGAEVAAALSDSIGLTTRVDLPALCDAIVDRAPQVLILDNAEHLLDEVAAAVGALRTAVPRLVIVVTSQAPLAVADETVVALRGLAIAEPRVEHSPAAQLFLARVSARQPDFELADADQPGLVRLLTELDGNPLAIELAAARAPLLGIGGLVDRLGNRLDLLSRGARDAPPRHGSLRAALGWSWDLLAPGTQGAASLLSTVPGPFRPWLAESMLGPDAVDHLDELLERSLLRRDPDGSLSLTSTVRAYAIEQLDDKAGAARLHARAVFEHFEPLYGFGGVFDGGVIARLRREQPHLAAALAWELPRGDAHRTRVLAELYAESLSRTGPWPVAVAMLDAVFGRHGPLPELIAYRALAGLHCGDVQGASDWIAVGEGARPGPLAAGRLGWASAIVQHVRTGAYDAESWRRAAQAYRQAGFHDKATMTDLAHVEYALDGGAWEAASEVLASLQHRPELDVPRLHARHLQVRGLHAVRTDPAQALVDLQASRAIHQEHGQAGHALAVAVALVLAELMAGEATRAVVRSEELEPAVRAFASPYYLAWHQRNAAVAHASAGQPERAEAVARGLRRFSTLRKADLDIVDVHVALAKGELGRATELLKDVVQALRDADTTSAYETGLLVLLAERQLERAQPTAHLDAQAKSLRCSWLSEPVELGRYASAWRICHALALAQGAPMDVFALFSAGWPGQRVLESSAKNRVYAELARLRRMGLRPAIERTDQGWRWVASGPAPADA